MDKNELSLNARRCLSTAYGWIDLKLKDEAVKELENIPAHLRSHPEVVAVWWEINCEQAGWPEYLKYGAALLAANPDDPMGFILLAESARLRSEDNIKDAYEILRPVADRFPDAITIPFNLACYACRLGRLEESREWLRKAFQTARATVEFDGYYQGLAIEETDLKPLWLELPHLSSEVRNNADWLSSQQREP